MTATLGGKSFDIVKVERVYSPVNLLQPNFGIEDATLLWEERPAVKLTVAEIEARLTRSKSFLRRNKS